MKNKVGEVPLAISRLQYKVPVLRQGGMGTRTESRPMNRVLKEIHSYRTTYDKISIEIQ